MSPFFDTTRQKSESKFRKVEFLDLPQGQTVIRILDDSSTVYKFHVHYLKGVYIKCLGEDCPVCKNNLRILSEYPDSFRETPGWSPKQERYAVNVLDKTLAKVCPSCNKEVKKVGTAYPPICPGCNQPIVEQKEAPLNKVKVLAKGVTVAEMLNGIDSSILDAEGNPIGITNYDIVLYVTGTGRDQKISAIPLSDHKEVIPVDEGSKFDLTKIAIELTPQEIADLIRGVSLRDIFIARQGTEEQKDSPEAGSAEEVRKQVRDLLTQ